MSDTARNAVNDLRKNSNNSFKAFAYEKIDVGGSAAVKKLTVPEGARYALLKLSSDVSGNAAMYLEFPGTVSATEGIPISDGTVFDITDTTNLIRFEIARITAGTTTLYIQYYK